MRIEILSSLFGVALLTAAAVVHPRQSEDDFQELDDSAWTDYLPPSKAQAERNAEMDRLIQGAWQLVAFEADDLDEYRRHDRAVALFGSGFFSIEMHITYESYQDGFEDIPGPTHFQSGTFRYRFDDEGQLLAKLSIGAAFDHLIRSMHYERPGSVRTFEIDIEQNRLELRREPGGFRYEFTRLQTEDQGRVDIFGRPARPELGGDPDFDPPNIDDPVEGDDPEDEEEDEAPRDHSIDMPRAAQDWYESR